MSQEGDTLTSSCLFLNTVVLGSCCVRPICPPPQVLRQICFFGRTHSCCPRAAVNRISSILLAKSIASDLLISVSYQASAWIQVTVWYKKSINCYLSCLYKLLLLAWNAGALDSLDTSVTEFTGGSWTLLAKERNWISSHPEWQDWGKISLIGGTSHPAVWNIFKCSCIHFSQPPNSPKERAVFLNKHRFVKS